MNDLRIKDTKMRCPYCGKVFCISFHQQFNNQNLSVLIANDIIMAALRRRMMCLLVYLLVRIYHVFQSLDSW
jgi:hypothetical protein